MSTINLTAIHGAIAAIVDQINKAPTTPHTYASVRDHLDNLTPEELLATGARLMGLGHSLAMSYQTIAIDAMDGKAHNMREMVSIGAASATLGVIAEGILESVGHGVDEEGRRAAASHVAKIGQSLMLQAALFGVPGSEC